MPSVVKCRHCGKNVGDPPEPRPSDGPASGAKVAQAVAGDEEASDAPPMSAAVEAALDPASPPAGVAFKPPVAVVAIQPAEPATAAPTGPPAPSSDLAADVQDWGAPVQGKTATDPYWQVKAVAPSEVADGGAHVKEKTDPKTAVSAVLLLAAGAVAIVASLQPWVSSSANGPKGVEDEVRRGFSGWEGKVTVALGLACVILALLSFVRKNAGPLKVGLVAGLGIAAVGVYTLVTATSQFEAALVAARQVEGMREEAARGLVAGWMDAGSLKVAPQMWLDVVIVAGLVACVAGLLAISVKVKPATAPSAKTSKGA